MCCYPIKVLPNAMAPLELALKLLNLTPINQKSKPIEVSSDAKSSFKVPINWVDPVIATRLPVELEVLV